VQKCGRDREVADDSITQHMRISYWISKATDTHSEYVIGLRVPCPLEQWLRESASMLRFCFPSLDIHKFHGTKTEPWSSC
jgi:hypothetical protein